MPETIKISLSQFKSKAIEVSDTVQKHTGILVKAIEDLKVAIKSKERAEDLLRKNKIQVETGTLAPIEIIDAEAGGIEDRGNNFCGKCG